MERGHSPGNSGSQPNLQLCLDLEREAGRNERTEEERGVTSFSGKKKGTVMSQKVMEQGPTFIQPESYRKL
ncbi:hypothetical protein E5288_WYG007297 [Bos mutus]|uniref:Uncharacterized protein n=1 Tax=Bos mutus TaxID=72004 RepID=A0A6B0S2Q3_9CETA|nr:hypothetical protein [Bos mutus]